jgi:DNA-binding CsgD family transcriptional regulator
MSRTHLRRRPAEDPARLPAEPPRFLGCELECDRIAAFLARGARGQGGALSVTGPPGIGKTALLDAAIARAEGWRVLRVSASRRRRVLAYSGLAELLGADPEVLKHAPEPLRTLVDGSDALPVTTPGDPLSVGIAVAEFLATLAEEQPVLLVVDDAHWLDRSSAEALSLAVTRGDAVPVAALLALRDSDHDGLAIPDFPTLVLEGLPDSAALQLVADVMVPEVAAAVARAAAGNPLAILAACTLLGEDQRRGRVPIKGPLPVPADLERAYATRLDTVSPGARAAVLVVACDERLDRGLVIEACRRLGVEDAEAAVAETEAALLLREHESGLAVEHPLLASAAYQSVEPGRRRAAHAAVAAMLRRDTDAERRAWHLASACAGRDETTAALLDTVGARALARGDPNAAAACFQRAVELSEDGRARLRRFEAAGDALVAAGRASEALDAFDQALELTDEPSARVDILVKLGMAGVFVRGTGITDQMESEVAAICDRDPAAAARLAAHAAFPAFTAGELPRARAFVARARALGIESDPVDAFIAAGLEAIVWEFEGDVRRALPALRAIAETPGLEEFDLFGAYVANMLGFADDFALAERLVERVLAASRAKGAPGRAIYPLTVRAEMRLRRGRFFDVRADAEEVQQLVVLGRRSADHAYVLCSFARAEACIGSIEVARTASARALEIADAGGIGFIQLWGGAARGFVELTDGRVDAAIAHLERAAEFAARRGIRLMAAAPWGPDLVEAYTRAGRRVDADALVRRLERDAGHAPTRWTVAVLARCRGLTADEGSFDDEFRAAIEAHEGVSTPFDAGRAHLCYGERLHRSHRPAEAAVQLERAAAIFEHLGASNWRNRAERLLGHATAREPRSRFLAELTSREYQVAQAVASGATNREVAAKLFLSTRTVEHHLASVYRKLGVRTRTQLANVFGGGEAPTRGS